MDNLSEKMINLQAYVVFKRTKLKKSILQYEKQNIDAEINILDNTSIVYTNDNLNIEVPDIQLDREEIKTLRDNKLKDKDTKITALEERLKDVIRVHKMLSNEKKCKITKKIHNDELL